MANVYTDPNPPTGAASGDVWVNPATGALQVFNGGRFTTPPLADAATVASAVPVPAGGSAAARLVIGSTAGFGIYVGSGAPTFAAAKGSLYLRTNGTTTNDRAYIASDGAGTWTALTTAA